MNYTLNKDIKAEQKGTPYSALKRLVPLLKGEEKHVGISIIASLVNAVAVLLAPVLIAHAVDTSIQNRDFRGVLATAALLIITYIVALVSNVVQTKVLGGVGRQVLFNLRNALFTKLQSLPVAFFNQNKSGDLISRINNDTDKLNIFFSQVLVQFMRSFFLILGAGIFMLSLNFRLGLAALVPALFVLVVSQFLSGWVKRKNLASLQSVGGLSAEIQESLSNFKVIVAFNRLDYFRQKFDEANRKNYIASVAAGYASNIYTPMYNFVSALAHLVVLLYGISLISSGLLTVGLLVGFFLYVLNFYMPLQQVATVWSSLQQSLAALDRIAEVQAMEPDMQVVPSEKVSSNSVLEFQNVSFRYPDGKEVLKHISLKLEHGKTYALVGPTGGGKTTTASLMARLYDPTEGMVTLDGRDIRSYSSDERVKKIGFILQEPFLFTGTVLENIFYGNLDFVGKTNEELLAAIEKSGMSDLLKHFEKGLETKIQSGGETISLGQRQLIAFVRAVLRKPDLLILDEATANIDTVTEQLLEDVIKKLPKETTKVVIAHRLNTIENADEIFFVNGGEVTSAGSLEHAVELLKEGKRSS